MFVYDFVFAFTFISYFDFVFEFVFRFRFRICDFLNWFSKSIHWFHWFATSNSKPLSVRVRCWDNIVLSIFWAWLFSLFFLLVVSVFFVLLIFFLLCLLLFCSLGLFLLFCFCLCWLFKTHFYVAYSPSDASSFCDYSFDFFI